MVAQQQSLHNDQERPTLTQNQEEFNIPEREPARKAEDTSPMT